MAYQTICFDLDGTLIDPKFGITKSVQYALSKYGIHEELDKLLPFIGPPLHKSFEKYYNFNEQQALEAVKYYREYFSTKGIDEAILYNGVPELLKKLKTKNKTLFVVTSKLKIFAEVLLAKHKLKPYFEKVIGANPNNPYGDKGSLIQETLLLLPDKQKQSIIMVGDKEHDIIGANANGIDSIGVLYGFGSEEELRSRNPTYIAATIEEIEKYL
ncbi:MAG TPA: HAD hydrolase-like protein [Candidatus Sulfotelmatobacter sp.]|jgi:phosphoglycolate phosphatase|nr:HAD hydrolase-like protein [Candidatus Sulfotelmatobacter sp.]